MEPESMLDFKCEEQDILAARERPTTRENQILLGICLVGSELQEEVQEGVDILNEIAKDSVHSEDSRVCVHYLALGYAKLKEYDTAVKLMDALLTTEPGNQQASDLKLTIEKKMKNDGLIGATILGGAAAALIGGIILVATKLRK